MKAHFRAPLPLSVVLLATLWLATRILGQPVQIDLAKGDWTVVEVVTDGETVIAILRPGPGTAPGGKDLNLQFDDYKAAREVAEALVASRKKIHGDRHWRVTDARLMADQLRSIEKLTAAQRGRLAEAAKLHGRARKLLDQGKPEAALPLSEQALKIRQQLLGKEAAMSMVSLNDVAHFLTLQRQYARAEPLLQEALVVSKRVLGEKHPDYAHCLNSLGELYYGMGRFAKVEPLWLQALSIRKETLGEKHPDYATNLNNVASLRGMQGRYGEAAVLYRQALAIRKEVLGEKDPDYAHSLNNLARTYDFLGQYDRAEPLFQRALAIRKEVLGEKHTDYAQTLDNLAGLYDHLGQYDKARRFMEQALAIRKEVFGEKDPVYATCLNNLAFMYCGHLRQHARAGPLYAQATAILGETLGEKHPEYLTSLDNLASFHTNTGQFTKAEALYLKVLAARKEVLGEKHPDTAVSLGGLASVYEHMGQYARAEPLAEQALAIDREVLGDRHPTYASSLGRRAKLHMAMRQYARAEPLLLQALAIRRENVGTKHPDYLVALNNLAALYKDLHQFARAEELGQQALTLARELVGEKHYYYALAIHHQASLYNAMGQPAKAERLYEQAVDLCKEASGEKSPDYVVALHNLAAHHMELHQFRKAMPLLFRSLELGKDVLGEKHPFYLSGLESLATLYGDLRDYTTAESLAYDLVKTKREVLGDKHPDYAASLHRLAHLYCQTEQYGKAGPIFRRALEIQKDSLGETDPAYATTLYHLACLHYDTHQYAEAEPLLVQSLAIHKSHFGVKHPRYATNLDALAALYQAMGDFARAEPLSREALRIVRGHVEQTADDQTEQQQLAFSRHAQLNLNRYLTIALARKVSAEEVYPEALAWKGMVWSRQLYTRRMTSALKDVGSEAARLASRLADARRKLANQTLAQFTIRPADKHQDDLDALGRDIEQLEKDLARASAPYRRQLEQRRPTLEKLRHCLPAEAVLIDFLEYWHHAAGEAQKKEPDEPCLAAFVIRCDRPVERIELGPMKPLTSAISRWRETFGAPRPGSKDDPGKKLREMIWEPLEPSLRDTRLVLVSPDESLGRLPFAALPGKEAGKYLIEERAVAVVAVPQLLPELLEANRTAEQEPSVLLIGGVDFDRAVSQAPSRITRTGLPRGFRPLPGSGAEITAIKDTFQKHYRGGKVTELSGPEATEEALRRLAGGHRFLHLATHGFFVENADLSALSGPASSKSPPAVERTPASSVAGRHPGLLSGLALAGANRPGDDAGGLLTAFEVADLDLTGVNLVTLSACGTGLGESARAEGLQGLQRAFQVAGARTVIASLWDVPDRPTQLLMQRFYENLWQKKKSRLEALCEAQLWVMKEMPKDPDRFRGGLERIDRAKDEQSRYVRYWAAFVLSGDWR